MGKASASSHSAAGVIEPSPEIDGSNQVGDAHRNKQATRKEYLHQYLYMLCYDIQLRVKIEASAYKASRAS